MPVGAPNPVVDQGLLAASGETASSPLVSTFSGQPILTIVKSNSPTSGTTLMPGDPITYTMDVQNIGSGNATGRRRHRLVPATRATSAARAVRPATKSAGTVTWTIGTLAPGDTATVTFTVSTSTSLPISATPYTISNSGDASTRTRRIRSRATP